MMNNRTLAGATLATVLLASACSPSQQPTAENDMMANADYENASGVIGEADMVEAVEVIPVPVPVSGTPTTAVAPLVEAASVAGRISEGSGVKRVSYEGGWAWRENGRIIRTASSDGRRVSYFRVGETTPYLVQQEGRAYTYSGGRVQRSYAGDGRPLEVDEGDRREGERLAQQSAQERTRAERVASEQPEQVQRERPTTGRTSDREDSPSGDERGSRGRDHSPGTERERDAQPDPALKQSSTPERDRERSKGAAATPRPEVGRDREKQGSGARDAPTERTDSQKHSS